MHCAKAQLCNRSVNLSLGYGLEGFLIMFADGGFRIDSKNNTGGCIECSNDAGGIRRNDAIGDGTEDVIHIALVFFDLLDCYIEIGKETCVIDGDSGLIAEGQQQIEMFGAEEVGVDAAIDVDRADAGCAYDQGSAHYGADAKVHDTFHALQDLSVCASSVRIGLRVLITRMTVLRLICAVANSLSGIVCAALSRAILNSGCPVMGWTSIKKPRSALTNSMTRSITRRKDFIELQRRIECTRDFIEDAQFITFLLQMRNTGCQCFTLTFKLCRGCWR